MGQVLHGCATTTEAVRRAIQNSQESLRALARRYGINQKTVAKWKQRKTVADIPTGPREAKSTVLSIEDEAVIVAFRRHTLLPLDDCLYALQPTIPHPTRSSLHRCLQRHGISRLPEVEGSKPSRWQAIGFNWQRKRRRGKAAHDRDKRTSAVSATAVRTTFVWNDVNSRLDRDKPTRCGLATFSGLWANATGAPSLASCDWSPSD